LAIEVKTPMGDYIELDFRKPQFHLIQPGTAGRVK